MTDDDDQRKRRDNRGDDGPSAVEIVDISEPATASKVASKSKPDDAMTPSKQSRSTTPKQSMAPPSRPTSLAKKRQASDNSKQITMRPKTPLRSVQGSAVEKMVEKINHRSPPPGLSAQNRALTPPVSIETTELPHQTQEKIDTQSADSTETSVATIADVESQPPPATEAVDDDDGWSPSDSIPEFDWNDLGRRHADIMEDFDRQEQAALDDFQQTMQLFEIWVAAGNSHDFERSTKRLRTRFAYIQHEEDELEQRRQHHVKVVRAFSAALDLLGPK